MTTTPMLKRSRIPLKFWFAVLLCSGMLANTVEALELQLPVDLADAGYLAYGVAPFGYHVAEHRYDGHPGIDIEFIPGRKVRAAHAGTFRYTVDMHNPALKSVTIEFQDGGVNYQLFYTNIAALEPGIANGVSVAAGQVFGTPGEVVRDMGNAGSFTYAMTHFQLADNRVSYGLSNFTAISPEPYFTEASRQVLAQIWQQSQYHQMICEPFFSTSRGVSPNPTIVRRWVAAAGSALPDIEFTCDFSVSDPNNSYQYRLIDKTHVTLESGTVVVTAVIGGVSSVDLTPAGASTRLGVIHVKDGAMQLDYSLPGGSRPVDLSAAGNYVSTDAVSCASSADALCFAGNASPYKVGDTLGIRLAIDWSKPSIPLSKANLWMALQMSTGEILFRHADEQWHTETGLYWKDISNLSTSVEVIDLIVPPGAEGNYTLYALLTEGAPGPDTLDQLWLSNLASALVYIGPE